MVAMREDRVIIVLKRISAIALALVALVAVAWGQGAQFPELPALTGAEKIPLSFVTPPANLPLFTDPNQIAAFVQSAGGGMKTNASNATLPTALNNLGLGTASTPAFSGLTLAAPNTASLSGPILLNGTYGILGSPSPTDPAFGMNGISSIIFATPGAGSADPISDASRGDLHLSAGTRGIAVGGFFRGYTDGTWGPGGSINAGSLGSWSEGHSSRGGATYGVYGLAQADTTAITSSLQGAQFDTNSSVAMGQKWGVAIVSGAQDTGAITGTKTISGSLASIPAGAGLFIQATGAGLGYPFGILTVKENTFTAPIPTTGSLWRAGGFTVVNGLDWGDMTFSGLSLSLPGFTVSGAGAVASAGNIAAGTGNLLFWTSRSTMNSPADGDIQLSNNAGSSFTSLKLGGVTSSFPEIKRNAAAINFRLADDSADAAVTHGPLTMSGITTGTNADFLCLSAGGVVLLQTSACTISSMRFKNLLGGYVAGGALATVAKLEPIVFTMKPGEKPNPDTNYERPQIGLSAENVAAIEPRCAIYEDDGSTPKSYRQECLIAILVAGMQAQQREIETLKAKR